MKKSLDDNDLDIETGEPKKKGGRSKAKKETPPATPNPPTPTPQPPSTTPQMANPLTPNPSMESTPPVVPGIPSVATAAAAQGAAGGVPGQGPTLNVGRPNEPSITYDWVCYVVIATFTHWNCEFGTIWNFLMKIYGWLLTL